MPGPDANSPAPIGQETAAAQISQREATYLPPDELASRYTRGIQRHYPAQPHASFTQNDGKNPHLIKKIDS